MKKTRKKETKTKQKTYYTTIDKRKWIDRRKNREKKRIEKKLSLKFSKIRLIQTGHNPAQWNMGVDQALMTTAEDSVPVLRLYGWKPSAVSIGYFQSLEEEVDVKKCKKAGIDVVRRLTGGGAVLHEHELTYSFITKIYPTNIMESYRLICEPVVMCLKNLGLDAKFSPLNDIIVGDKKVSGNAQTRRKNTLLQHGTILLDVDVEKMFSVPEGSF